MILEMLSKNIGKKIRAFATSKERRLQYLSILLKALQSYIQERYIVISKKAMALRLLSPGRNNFSGYHLTNKNREEIDKIWHGIGVDTDWFCFFNSIKREDNKDFDARYIPMDFSYAYLHPYFNDTYAAEVIDDKNLYDLTFKGFTMPRTICRIIDNVVMDADYRAISMREASNLCKSEGQVIVKPSDIQCFKGGGGGIRFINADEDAYDVLQQYNNCIVQEVLKQHEALASLHKESLNTIRMVTLNDKGIPQMLSAVVRIGVKDNKIDNASAGGIFCGIHEDGRLMKYAYNRKGDLFERHPDGAIFEKCVIPNYNRCIEVVKELSFRFVKFARLVAWDLAIREDGEPVVIESNMPYSGIDLFQIVQGPLFGDRTIEIVDKITSSNHN